MATLHEVKGIDAFQDPIAVLGMGTALHVLDLNLYPLSGPQTPMGPRLAGRDDVLLEPML